MNRISETSSGPIFTISLFVLFFLIGSTLVIRNTFSITVYYVLIYVFYLVLLELTPQQQIPAWQRRWSNRIVGAGFIGWAI